MKLINVFIFIGVSALVGGCETRPTNSPSESFFHPWQVEKNQKDDANTIRGSALIRQKDGGIINCAGNTVYLFPATPIAIKQMLGTCDSQSNPTAAPQSSSPYSVATRQAICDSQGSFEFQNISDGNFLVAIPIHRVIDYSKQCGWLMRRITAEGGEVKHIDLSP